MDTTPTWTDLAAAYYTDAKRAARIAADPASPPDWREYQRVWATSLLRAALRCNRQARRTRPLE